MTVRYMEPEAECAPVPELVAGLEERLANTDLFLRAARSPLYSSSWRAAGINPAAIRSYADLRRVPFTSSADLRVAQATNPYDDFVCSEQRPRLWVSTSGSTGEPKWVPIGAKDLETARRISFRLDYFGKEPSSRDDVALGVSAPAPFISDASLWPGLINALKGDRSPDIESGEVIGTSFEGAEDAVSMALKRGLTAIVAFPSLAMRIADGLSEAAPVVARNELRKKFNLKNLLIYLYTRVRKVKPRDFVHVHTGLFAGEPLEPYRKPLYDAWGLRLSYNLYTFSEYQVVFLECSAQDGLHVWLDVSLPEIIYQADLDREREEEGYVPPAHPLWEATAGDEGELVLTHWGDAFPLVRWRTSDLIRVVSTEPCPCGRTLPRVDFLQRSDDLVNLGVIRVGTFEIKEKLDAISQPTTVAGWQLRVSRVGYKPLLRILIRPSSPVDQTEMIAAVRAAVDQLESLHLGVEGGLVCEPVIEIVHDLEDRLSTSGKFRPLVYEE
jgi:phenylacetate-CoA ligase